jgi:biotin transporter BioY
LLTSYIIISILISALTERWWHMGSYKLCTLSVDIAYSIAGKLTLFMISAKDTADITLAKRRESYTHNLDRSVKVTLQ